MIILPGNPLPARTIENSGAYPAVMTVAHRVVEILADSGRDDRVAQFVTDNLAWLVEGFVIDNVTDLIEEARAAGKAVPGG